MPQLLFPFVFIVFIFFTLLTAPSHVGLDHVTTNNVSFVSLHTIVLSRREHVSLESDKKSDNQV